MNPSPDGAGNAENGRRPPDFTTLLTEAIQLYADAVAAHALRVEGVPDVEEDSESVEVARARLRRLLSLIPPLSVPEVEGLESAPSLGGGPASEPGAK